VRSTLVGRGAAPPDQPVILEPGSAIDARYRLEERIAGGGMGEVWRARDDVLGRDVALKVLRPEYADDPEFRARFRAEARHTAALSHPGIATVHDYGEVEAPDAHGNLRTSPYLVLELVPGESLARLLAREGRLPCDRALDVLAQAGRALQAAHDAGIVHRDVAVSPMQDDVRGREPPATVHAGAIDPGAVTRHSVIDEGPHAADALERRVDPRRVRVPGEGDLVARPAPDREAIGRPERGDPLRALPVTEDQEGGAGTPGLEHGLELGGRGRGGWEHGARGGGNRHPRRTAVCARPGLGSAHDAS